MVSGGPSFGRVGDNNCFAVDSPQGTGLPPAQGATSAAGLLYCDVKPPFQPNVKLLGVYPLPWRASSWRRRSRACRDRRSRPTGPTPTPRSRRRSAAIWRRACRHRHRAADPAGHDVRRAAVPGRLPRVEDLQVRPRSRIQANVDLYNAGNASSILAINITYGSTGCGRPHPAGPAGEVRRADGFLAISLSGDRAGSQGTCGSRGFFVTRFVSS